MMGHVAGTMTEMAGHMVRYHRQGDVRPGGPTHSQGHHVGHLRLVLLFVLLDLLIDLHHKIIGDIVV